MKNFFAILILFVAVTGCKKNQEPSNPATTSDITLASNKSYQYNLGTVKLSDVSITTAAAHASASKLAFISPGSDSAVFIFVPDTNYIGTDQVILTVHENHTCDHHHHDKGNCGGKSHHQKGNCANKSEHNTGGKGTKHILNFTVSSTSY